MSIPKKNITKNKNQNNSYMDNENMKKINLTISLLFITLFWWTLVFFTISWDLPGTHTPETDGITSKLNLSAREMMRADTYKYPPLQYLIADAFTANIPENILSQNELEQKRTQRIIAYRTISAVMVIDDARQVR